MRFPGILKMNGYRILSEKMKLFRAFGGIIGEGNLTKIIVGTQKAKSGSSEPLSGSARSRPVAYPRM